MEKQNKPIKEEQDLGEQFEYLQMGDLILRSSKLSLTELMTASKRLLSDPITSKFLGMPIGKNKPDYVG